MSENKSKHVQRLKMMSVQFQLLFTIWIPLRKENDSDTIL